MIKTILLLVGPIAAATLAAQDPPKVPRGDAANGKALVASSKCLDCHRVGETGSRVGPDLSEVGSLRSTEQLRRALVAPDDDVLPEHRFVRIVTRDGAVVVGRLLNQDAFSVQLMTGSEQLESYSKTDLREITIQVKGLMPSYAEKLNAQQIADMVRYLWTLKGEEK
jgi:putative heme-binding domain-containing protein